MSGMTLMNEVFAKSTCVEDLFDGYKALNQTFAEHRKTANELYKEVVKTFLKTIPDADKVKSADLGELRGKADKMAGDVPAGFKGVKGLEDWVLWVQYHFQKDEKAGKLNFDLKVEYPDELLAEAKEFGLDLSGINIAIKQNNPYRFMKEMAKLLKNEFIVMIMKELGYGDVLKLVLAEDVAKLYD